MTDLERAALVEVVRAIRGAPDEESALVVLRAAVTDAMAAAVEKCGTGAWFERLDLSNFPSP